MIGIIIVMMIVGAMTAALAPMLLSKYNQSRAGTDRQSLEAAKSAIIGYALSKGKFPPPVDASGGNAIDKACDVNGAQVALGTAGSTACRMPPSTIYPALGVNNWGVFGDSATNPFRMDVNSAVTATTSVKDLCSKAQTALSASNACQTPNVPCVCQDAACSSKTPVAFVLYSTGGDRVPNGNNALTTRVYDNDNRGIDNSAGGIHYDDQVVSYPLSSLVNACAKMAGLPVCNVNAVPKIDGAGNFLSAYTFTASCSNMRPSAPSSDYTWTSNPSSLNPSGTGGDVAPPNVSPDIPITYSVSGKNELGSGPSVQVIVPSNVALASAGGVATASSTYSGLYPAAAVNNGERAGAGWGAGGGWNDNTNGVYPDWVQIAFSGAKTIDRVIVYTLQDNFAAPIQPLDSTTFSLYGVTDYNVQVWDGAAWISPPGMVVVSGNNRVKRTVSFTPTTTSMIRLNITGANGYSRLTEIEAWTPSVTPVPVCAPTAVPAAIALGGTTTLAANCTGAPTSYVWTSNPSGQPLPAGAGGAVSPAVSTVYTVSASNGGGGGSAAPVSVTVTPPPVCTLTANPLQVVSGGASTLTASCTNSPTSYTWSNPPAFGALVTSGTVNPVGTTTYTVQASNAGGSSNIASATVTVTATPSNNVALAAASAVASASSQYSANYPVASVNNDERAGTGWGTGNTTNGGWNDATAGVYPDWVQIDFNGPKTLTSVVVYTVQNNYAAPQGDPLDGITFSLYGVTDFTVQGLATGTCAAPSTWSTLGTVTANNLVKRTVPVAYTGSCIRVNITASAGANDYSRITEIEAWGN